VEFIVLQKDAYMSDAGRNLKPSVFPPHTTTVLRVHCRGKGWLLEFCVERKRLLCVVALLVDLVVDLVFVLLFVLFEWFSELVFSAPIVHESKNHGTGQDDLHPQSGQPMLSKIKTRSVKASFARAEKLLSVMRGCSCDNVGGTKVDFLSIGLSFSDTFFAVSFH
jgi:hypothetical protein